MKVRKKISIYSSFEQENKAESARRSHMNTEARIKEFSIIQERRWGKNWTMEPIVKKARYETVDW